ncbi:MAG TPA: flagellin [Bryobacteraceae bacterium]|nr:flagellin [Bryobacteraceae bacterium]
MISIQTNVDSLTAQRNLNVNNQLQSKTIQQLTSGYRINSSGDDAAGLAVANGYRSTIAQITQGVSNGNDGLSQLQIIDGGLNNIATILDRLQTLATQSASSTFTGDRATLNQEYQQQLLEITRQASNINLASGGTLNNVLSVYIGGANNATDATVSVNLSGTANAVDSTSLGLATSNVLGGGVGFNAGVVATRNTLRIDAPGATFVVGAAGTNDASFAFNVFSNGSARSVTATVAASTGGSTLSAVLTSLNGQLNKYGITAGVDSNGLLQFSGSNAFTVTDTPGTGTSKLTNETGASLAAKNTSNYSVDGAAAYVGTIGETLQFQTSNGPSTVILAATTTLAAAIAQINGATASQGVYAVLNAAGTGISFQSSSSFSVSSTTGTGTFGAAGGNTAVAPATGSTNNATSAINAIASAIKALGLVQGQVGAGQNKLSYAIKLANSQISSYSTAQSQIRDADIAAAAADLSKSQVLTQTSVAALAQANSESQAILKLLQ